MAKIYFAKINLIDYSKDFKEGKVSPGELMDKILNQIHNKTVVEDEQDKNILYRLELVDINYEKKTVNGRLLRISKQMDIETLTTIDSDEKEINTLSNVISSVSFSLKTDSEKVAFVPKQSFGRSKFLEYFQAILQRDFAELGKIDMQMIFDRGGLYDKLKKIDKLTLLEFVIVKPNGVADDLVESIGDTLIDTDSDKAVLSFSGTKNSPMNKESDIFQKLIDYTSKGWGRIKGKGYDGDTVVNIDTEKDILKNIPISNESKESPLYIQDRAYDYED